MNDPAFTPTGCSPIQTAVLGFTLDSPSLKRSAQAVDDLLSKNGKGGSAGWMWSGVTAYAETLSGDVIVILRSESGTVSFRNDRRRRRRHFRRAGNVPPWSSIRTPAVSRFRASAFRSTRGLGLLAPVFPPAYCSFHIRKTACSPPSEAIMKNSLCDARVGVKPCRIEHGCE